MTLYLEIDEFATMYGQTLTEAQTEQATLLLTVVDARIRGLKSDANPDAAKQVAFEVVRDAIMYGALERLSSFTNITSHRQEAGVFNELSDIVDDYLSNKHKRLLGIALRAGPVGSFPKCDW